MRTLTKLALTAALAVAFTFHTSFAQCTASLFAGGAGTAASPYQIGTPQQLQNLNQCLGEDYQGNHYVLNNDIDLTAYLQNSETGWEPIGNYVENSDDFNTGFYGKFNGNGHKVSGLWINRPEANFAGLFGVGAGTEIKNIGVEIDNAKGGIKGNRYVGGLAGCVSFNPSDPAISTVSNSYATGNVTGNRGVGGLVGFIEASSIISNSYATGSITGDRYIGGLVGVSEKGVITNSYAIGSVTGNSGVGGLVGNINSSTIITNSYYDIQTTGQTDTDKGTGKTTAEMKTQSTYEGWDFETIWEINAAKNSGYPALRWQTNTTPIRLPQIATGSIRVQSTANAIVLENLPKNAKVELYNLQGKQIYSTHSENSQILKIQVQTKGIYVMKTSNQIMRVVVR